MSDWNAFHRVWHDVDEFDGPPELNSPEPSLCPYAQEFWHWCRELCADFEQRATVVTVNQKKILLLDKYFDWRTVVPKAHRNRIGVQGHRCVWHVFEECYLNLKAVELALTPPLLFLPPKPPRPPKVVAPQAGGIFLGEIAERSDG